MYKEIINNPWNWNIPLFVYLISINNPIFIELKETWHNRNVSPCLYIGSWWKAIPESHTLTQRPLNERNTLTTLFKLFNVEFLYIEKYFDIYTQNKIRIHWLNWMRMWIVHSACSVLLHNVPQSSLSSNAVCKIDHNTSIISLWIKMLWQCRKFMQNANLFPWEQNRAWEKLETRY